MRIIITGGSGFLGRTLIDYWSDDKHEISILSRDPDKVQKKIPSHVRIIQWDGRTKDGWGNLINETDVIINLAGSSIAGGFRWTKKRKKLILESRVNAGQAVVDAIQSANNKPKLLLQASGVNYYGFTDKKTDESASHGNDYLSEVCKEWEASTAKVDNMGVRRIVLRTSVVLSKKGGALKLMTLPYKLFIGGRLTLSGKQWFSWIHYLDFVKMIDFFIENEETIGVFNISSPNPIRQKELNRTMGRVLRRPWFFHAPGFTIRLFFGEKADLLLKDINIEPKRLQQAGFKFNFIEIESAIRNISSSKN
ncbi:MAG: TIGR01777 family oxidoreductase [Candidatus Hodarchaeales archaeon]|jgi:uncharacterized protein (TIGR01777 family)